MSLLAHELRLFLRQRIALPTLILMALLSAAAVFSGIAEVRRQNEIIARIQPQQAEDVSAVRAWVSKDGDAGSAAYYTFHATWDTPAPLAFAALGQRDVAPYVLRVRALALESQIHEGENYNPEMALPGRFDWAFVLTYLAPLFLIALLHDLHSSEREARRMDALQVMARSPLGLWMRRIGLRVGLLFAAIALPFAAGAAWSGAGLLDALIILALALAYLLFWAAIALLVAGWRMGSVANAATLAASWLALTLILPALALLAINAAFPVRQGVELTLAQREAVHGGWDKAKEATMQAFFRHHPEWRDTTPVAGGFHWKWYFAFHHLGDLSVADQINAYRNGLEARDRWTRWLGLLLPAVGVQVATHRLADTDLAAQLAYQDRIRSFHGELRRFYYPYLFNDVPFREADFAKAPRWARSPF
jgi:ABC-2 type transport system permease protein